MNYNKGQGALEYLLIIGVAIIVVAIIIISILGIIQTPTQTTNDSHTTIQSGYDRLLDRVILGQQMNFASGYNEFLLTFEPENPSLQINFNDVPEGTNITVKRNNTTQTTITKTSDGWEGNNTNIQIGDVIQAIIPEGESVKITISGKRTDYIETQVFESDGLIRNVYLETNKNLGELFSEAPTNLVIQIYSYYSGEYQTGRYTKTSDGWTRNFGALDENPHNVQVRPTDRIRINSFNPQFSTEITGELTKNNIILETSFGAYAQIVENNDCLTPQKILENIENELANNFYAEVNTNIAYCYIERTNDYDYDECYDSNT